MHPKRVAWLGGLLCVVGCAGATGTGGSSATSSSGAGAASGSSSGGTGAPTTSSSSSSSTGGGSSGALTAGYSLSAGQFFTCTSALGSLWCWGINDQGQLGIGSEQEMDAPQLVSIPAVAQVAAGHALTCALLVDGTVRCWGNNDLGELGDGTTQGASCDPDDDATCEFSPVQVVGLHDVVQIAVGALFACALDASGAVWCWGDDRGGAVGISPPSEGGVPQPTQVPGLDQVAQIAAGQGFACALKTDGSVWCWGDNLGGELCDGTTNNTWQPEAIAGVTGAVQISLGDYFGCAVRSDGSLVCWGSNSSGQLGAGDVASSPCVRTALVSNGVMVGTGEANACAILADGSVSCWGDNGFGQRGDGTMGGPDCPTPEGESGQPGPGTCQPMPGTVQKISSATDISLGESQCCVLQTDHSLWCWGSTSTSSGATPTEIAL